MRSDEQFDFDGVVMHHLVKLGCQIKVEDYDRWLWLEKEITFKGKNYLVGANLKRDSITMAIEISKPELLLKQ